MLVVFSHFPRHLYLPTPLCSTHEGFSLEANRDNALGTFCHGMLPRNSARVEWGGGQYGFELTGEVD